MFLLFLRGTNSATEKAKKLYIVRYIADRHTRETLWSVW